MRSLRQIPSGVPNETCAKGEGKLPDVVLRPLLASSPEVIALLSFVMFVSVGAKANGGPRGDGSPLTSSIIFINLAVSDLGLVWLLLWAKEAGDFGVCGFALAIARDTVPIAPIARYSNVINIAL